MSEVATPETAAVPAAPPAATEGAPDVKPESSTGPADTAAEPRKKSGGFQKRIDRLTKTVYELQAQLEAAKGPKPQATDEKEPKRDDFEDLETYQRALAEHTAKKVFREHSREQEESRKQAQAREANAKRQSSWESHSERAAEKYDDGEDVISHFASEVQLSGYALDAILESEIGHELMYYLGKHDNEVARLAKLSPSRQASEIGKLEARLSEAPKKTSSAPAPIEPVTGKGAAETGLSENLSTAEWIKRRQKQVHGR